jgi:flagellum-specific peptidoglycan hydrolase FlgJ
MENQSSSKQRYFTDPEYRAKIMEVVMNWRKKNPDYDQYTKQYWREYFLQKKKS